MHYLLKLKFNEDSETVQGNGCCLSWWYNVVGRINEVTLRRVRLALRWVTFLSYTALVFNQAMQAYHSLVIPSWLGGNPRNEY